MNNRYTFNEIVEGENIITSFSAEKKVNGRVAYLGKIYIITSCTGAGKSFALGLYHPATKKKLLLKGEAVSRAKTIIEKG